MMQTPPKSPTELVAEALAELAALERPVSIAQHLEARGVRGDRHDGARDALAAFLGARAGVAVHTHATTLTVLEVVDAGGHHVPPAELELPLEVVRFVRYLGRGMYPELLGEPTAGTTGPLSSRRPPRAPRAR